MRCKECEYRLWSLRSRNCPECGAAFKPSDFELVPGSVRFCCPHCGQAYYGTSLKGHLEPIAFDCGSCGHHIHMDEMVLLPGEGVEEEDTAPPPLPWPDRKRVGTIRAWFRMIGLALVAPGRLGRSIPPQASTGAALWFGFLTTFLLTAVSVSPFFAFMLVPALMTTPAGGGGGPGMVGLAGVFGSMLLFICGVMTVLMVLTALVAHGLLRLTGETAGGLGRTCRAVYYSAGANALTAIPCVGAYIGWIWWVVSGAIVVKEAQRVHGGRAALAVLAVPVGAVALFSLFYGGMLYMFFSAAPFNAGAGGGPNAVSAAIDMYVEDNDDWPGHGIELITRGYLGAHDLAILDARCPISTWSIDGVAFEELPDLPVDRSDAIEAFARERLPEDVIAHRVGDWVFTYHGIDRNLTAPELWIAASDVDPNCDLGLGAPSMLEVVTLDGEVRRMRGDRSNWIRSQNMIRATHGLPPLPDLSTITHDKPAAAGP